MRQSICLTPCTILRLIIVLLVCQEFGLAQAVPYPTARIYALPGTEPPEHPLDMQHMRVEVRFDPVKKLVMGKVTHFFVPIQQKVDSVFFNGPAIRIIEATLNGRKLRYRTSAEGITVYPEPALMWDTYDSITFVYEANPAKGLYFTGWDDPRGMSRKQIWTQGQGIDNRHWIPCYDEQNDKLTTETIITIDREYNVLSNGTKISQQDNGDGTRTWHYRMMHPHTTYLVMLGIGEYAVKTITTKGGVPVHLWYYPEFPDRVDPTYIFSAECIDFMADETGVPYPWESYSQIPVQDYIYGAMENTTATVFGDFYLIDKRSFHDKNYIAVNVHELAHQWFGDYITGRSGKSAWLHESFATFYPTLFLKTVYGEDRYDWERREEQKTALAASLVNRLPVLHTSAGGERAYQKGAAVLDMMVYTFGKEEFRRVIRRYLTQHAHGSVETNDFYQTFQDALGITPDWFFEQWIYRGGEPHYAVTFEDAVVQGVSGRQSSFLVRQLHEVDELVKLFRMPIVFEVHYTDGSAERAREWVAKESERIIVPNPKSKPVAFVLFDPGGHLLKTVTFEKPLRMLKAQALGAPLMIDRYDAIAALRTVDLTMKRDVLLQAYGREAFFGIKAEIVAQLVNDPDEKSVALVRKALRDKDAAVRTSVIQNIGVIPAYLRGDLEKLLRDSSYTTEAAALTKLTAQFPDDTHRFLEITKDDHGMGNQVSVLWNEISARNGNAGSLAQLIDYCSISYEFRTRINALEAVKRLNACSDSLIPHLFSAMTHFNPRLRAPADAVVTYFLQQTVFREKLVAYYRSRTWTQKEREFLEPFIK